jgi:hypothetical protein
MSGCLTCLILLIKNIQIRTTCKLKFDTFRLLAKLVAIPQSCRAFPLIPLSK